MWTSAVHCAFRLSSNPGSVLVRKKFRLQFRWRKVGFRSFEWDWKVDGGALVSDTMPLLLQSVYTRREFRIVRERRKERKEAILLLLPLI